MNASSKTSAGFMPLCVTAVLFAVAGCCFAIVNLVEFYNTGIAGNTSGYPWGSVNENPWYYRSPGTYAAYCLAAGLLLLFISATTIFSVVKKKYGIAAVCTVILFVLLFVFLAGAG